METTTTRRTRRRKGKRDDEREAANTQSPPSSASFAVFFSLTCEGISSSVVPVVSSWFTSCQNDLGTEAREGREDPLLRLRVLGGLLLNRAPALQRPHFLIREDPRSSAADFLASEGDGPRIRADRRGLSLAGNGHSRASGKGAHRAPYVLTTWRTAKMFTAEDAGAGILWHHRSHAAHNEEKGREMARRESLRIRTHDSLFPLRPFASSAVFFSPT